MRQIKEALLIVDDVEEVDVGSRLRAALLTDAISSTTEKNKKDLYLQAHQAAVERWLVRYGFCPNFKVISIANYPKLHFLICLQLHGR